MIVTCPECGTQFRIDPSVLGESGRRVRCSSCGHRWLVVPPAATADIQASPPSSQRGPATVGNTGPMPSAADLEEPVPVVPPSLPTDSPPLVDAPELGQPSEGRRTAVISWLFIVLALLVLTGLFVGRNEIAAAFPAALPIYQKLGLPIIVRSGLELRQLTTRRVDENGVIVLVVEGEIHNVTHHERQLPAVRVALLDGNRKEVDFGLFDIAQKRLAAGGVARFEARLVDPPPVAKTFRVTLETRS